MINKIINSLEQAITDFDFQKANIQIAIEALKAHDAGQEAFESFVQSQSNNGKELHRVCIELYGLPKNQPEGVDAGLEFAREILADNTYKKVLECSDQGDKRFSAKYALLTINGIKKTIDEWYWNSLRRKDGSKVGPGEKFDFFIDPYTGSKLPADESVWMYRGLWISYFDKNPELVKYAQEFDVFSNIYSDHSKIDRSNHVMIETYVKGDRERYKDVVKCSKWYKNIIKENEIRSMRKSKKYEKDMTGR